MSQIVFLVEPELRGGGRWHMRHRGCIRATCDSRAQAIVDARRPTSFETELRGVSAIVRVLDTKRELDEDRAGPERTRAAAAR